MFCEFVRIDLVMLVCDCVFYEIRNELREEVGVLGFSGDFRDVGSFRFWVRKGFGCFGGWGFSGLGCEVIFFLGCRVS